jgi:hypothetical protein
MDKLVTNDEARTLTECYKLGCLIEGKPVVNDDMLDLIRLAEHARRINVIVGLIIDGNLPCYFANKGLSIVCDKANSLNINKTSEVKTNES